MAIPTVAYAVVVDDDPLILRHACDIPEEAGFRFHEAGTGKEAETLLADHADGVTATVLRRGDARRQLTGSRWPITLPSIGPGSRS